MKTQIRERSKDKSKQQFLDAVGKILKTKGHAGLKVNDIAATAGLDKKLIYKYFGGTDQLLDEYLRAQDFWSNVQPESPVEEINDGGQEFIRQMLLRQFDYVAKNKEFQKVLIWGLSQQRKSLKKLRDEQEKNGEFLLKSIMDPHFGERADTCRAILAILVSGIYYLDMYPTVNGSVFCGLDLKSREGRVKVEEAISFLLEQTYTHL